MFSLQSVCRLRLEGCRLYGLEWKSFCAFGMFVVHGWNKRWQIFENHAIWVGVLKGLGCIMYDTKCPQGDEMVSWSLWQLNNFMNRLPIVNNFWTYFTKPWTNKTHMWIVGHWNLPYTRLDTNAAIENYHSNLKATVRASKGRAYGRHLDWVIYELTMEILSHYW